MKNLTPRHISDVESDWRGVKDGWYAVGKTGKLGGRVFPNRFECAEHIEHLKRQRPLDRGSSVLVSVKN